MAKAKAKDGEGISRFEIDGEVLEIDMEQLTLGEIEFVEVYFNVPFEAIDWESGRGVLMIASLAKARKRKITIPAAMDTLRDVKVTGIKEAKADRPTEKPESSGTPD